MKMCIEHITRSPAWKAAGLGTAGLALSLLLAGCESTVGFTPTCPSVAVVRDAGSFVNATPAGDLAAKATMTDFSGTCEYDETGVKITAALSITAETGPAHSGGPVQMPYFVAITDPNRNILQKQMFTATVSGGGTVTEQVTQFIPLPNTVDGRYYEVLAGFQLSADQIDANMARNARTR